MVENDKKDAVVCENALPLSQRIVLNNNSDATKVRIDRFLGDAHLHLSTFFISDKIIDMCRDLWDKEESHFYVRVDVVVFISTHPESDYLEFDCDINFVSVSQDSIE